MADRIAANANDEHQHSCLALFAPADVFHGRVDEVAALRQQALDAAYTAHPERFPHGPPVVKRPPAAVHINPISTDDVAVISSPQSPAESTRGTTLSSNELAREASATQPVASSLPRQGAAFRPHASRGDTRDALPASVPS